MNLILHLNKEFFEQIAIGHKAEEFRLVTPYWEKRLVQRQYEFIILLCGYPKRGDLQSQIIRPWQGYTIRTIIHPHFGKNEVKVFAINVSIPIYDHIWFWRARLPERKGHPCRVLARGRMNNILVEFQDGYKVVTGRYAVRKASTQANYRLPICGEISGV